MTAASFLDVSSAPVALDMKAYIARRIEIDYATYALGSLSDRCFTIPLR